MNITENSSRIITHKFMEIFMKCSEAYSWYNGVASRLSLVTIFVATNVGLANAQLSQPVDCDPSTFPPNNTYTDSPKIPKKWAKHLKKNDLQFYYFTTLPACTGLSLDTSIDVYTFKKNDKFYVANIEFNPSKVTCGPSDFEITVLPGYEFREPSKGVFGELDFVYELAGVKYIAKLDMFKTKKGNSFEFTSCDTSDGVPGNSKGGGRD